TTSFDPNAKLAKDIAAGAVLIASVTAVAVGFLVFQSAVGQRATHALDRVRDAPADITLVALFLVVILVIATKAWTGRGTPLRGGLPSGHAAVAFAGWVAVTYLIGDPHRFVVSAVTLIMALLVAQTRVESGIHARPRARAPLARRRRRAGEAAAELCTAWRRSRARSGHRNLDAQARACGRSGGGRRRERRDAGAEHAGGGARCGGHLRLEAAAAVRRRLL